MATRLPLFPGIPVIESPVFEAELAALDLNETEREIAIRLNRYGYAAIDFPDPFLDERIERIKANLTPRFGLVEGPVGPVSVQVGRIQDAWHFDEDVRAIASNPDVMSLISRLYGRAAFPFQTLNFPVGTQQAVHTDTVHFSSVPERFMCGVWVALEDIGPDNGPLFYIPGSHRWPILSNSLIGRRGWGHALRSAQDPYGPAWAAMIEASGAQGETFIARKGQAVIWCANLLHGGSPHLDPNRTRWSQVTHYFFDDCIYYTPAYSDEFLGRLQLRSIVNAADGTPRPNLYCGEVVKPHPPAKALSFKARLRRHAARLGKRLKRVSAGTDGL